MVVSDESLESNITGQDRIISLDSGLPPIIHVYQRLYNPMHYFSRLKELGFSNKESKRLTEIYEIGIFTPVIDALKEKYKSSE